MSSGADIVGVNCHFDPFASLESVKKMKKALDAAGMKAHLMIQPLAYHTPDCGKQGFIDLPDFPFCKQAFFRGFSLGVFFSEKIEFR